MRNFFNRQSQPGQSCPRYFFMAVLVVPGLFCLGCGQTRHKERLAESPKVLNLASATNEINLGTNDIIVEAAGAEIDLSGRRLVEKVRDALETDPRLSGAADRITVRAQGGKIILSGSVAGAREKSDIMTRASAVIGPENLVDRLEMVPEAGQVEKKP